DLTQRATTSVLGALVPALAADHQVAVINLNGDVALGVHTGQLDSNDGVVAIAAHLSGRVEAGGSGNRCEGGTEQHVEIGERVPATQHECVHERDLQDRAAPAAATK